MAVASSRGRRRSIRLRGHDYTRPGAYFLTIVTRGRACLFGEVTDGEMRLNRLGEIVEEEWFKCAVLRPYVALRDEEAVIMPNHIHAVMWIEPENVGARRRRAPTTEGFGAPAVASVPTIVRAFKSATTRRINTQHGTPGAPLWQRNYYEHVIRGDDQLAKTRRYIATNPLQWELDRENQNAMGGADVPSIDEPWRE
jgi:REP element-mobilizing transposase RayT